MAADKALRRRALRTVLLALVLGGACGALVGLGYFPPSVGVGCAVLVAVVLAVRLRRLKKAAQGRLHAPAKSPESPQTRY